MRRVFVGPSGVRAGWRLALFLALAFVLTTVLSKLAYSIAVRCCGYAESPGWVGTELLFEGCVTTGALLLALLLQARIEGCRLADYGLPRRGAFGKRFWEGMLWGLATSSVVPLVLLALGNATVHGLASRGRLLAESMLLWGLAFLVLAVYEELLFRGYSLSTLAGGMGFWPAAVLLALLFGAVHVLKPMESWIDITSVMLYGLVWSYTVWRTGTLWFAIGFHTMANFTELVVFGAPNTGNLGRPLDGRLLDVQLRGPEWLTGGPRGPKPAPSSSWCSLRPLWPSAGASPERETPEASRPPRGVRRLAARRLARPSVGRVCRERADDVV